VFTPPRDRFRAAHIVVWRSIPERENCTLDATLADGRTMRLHVKRYHPQRGLGTPADEEAQGIRALQIEQIPTAPLVGWGQTADGRSFIITEDLAGYGPADKRIAQGLAFDRILTATADLAAKLHSAGLHHRDLYLCHFFVREDEPERDVRLIDAARVRRLPGWPLRRRWIVKDLAQFWYSMQSLPITEGQRAAWFERYAQQVKPPATAALMRAVERKARSIARHDVRLRQQQPGRNISIPGSETKR
jgi:heptose I phosphotransferase